MMMFILFSNIQATFQTQVMKKLNHTEVRLKKGVTYKKTCNSLIIKEVTS